mmetsp:Transcript_7066/g.8136  ORF Transcript_7066/g.8136 Transcript_7066/m.8136 type:complete len:327 (-) Transcript_7066:116-1096(-)
MAPMAVVRRSFVLLTLSMSLATAFQPIRRSITTSFTQPTSVRSTYPHPTTTTTTRFMSSDDDNTPGLPFALPSLNQIFFVWLTGVAGSRLIKLAPLAASGSASQSILINVAINVVLFAGCLTVLINSLRGIDYTALEGLDSKSLANQAGEWASSDIIPTTYKEYKVATFAGGCFWGTELHFQRIEGVIATCVGYTQGKIEKPSYEQVCSGTTGHTEGLQLIYDPTICSYERLLTALFATLDPTLLNRVKNDKGTQYRHGVYTHSLEQAQSASKFVENLQSQYGDPIVTEVLEAKVFYPAENYHQRYLEKGGQSADKDCEETVRCYG